MTTASEKFYDQFSLLYPLVDLFLKPQKKNFFDIINSLPYGQLLEVGIGNGSNLKYYTTHNITGIDTSRRMLAQARKHVKDNVELLHMNGETLLFPNERFDYVILSHVIAVVEDPEKLLAEVHRVLKPDGKVFILNHFTPTNWLRYLDKSAETISSLVHVKSVFRPESLHNLQKFRLVSQRDAGLFSYFQILIYEKNR